MTMERANKILKAILVNEETIKNWWNSPNLVFGMATPAQMWICDSRKVLDYLYSQVDYNYS